MPDAHKNFAYSTVATAPSPATSGTSLVVASGEGARFPAVPFNATIWPATGTATPANAEIVRVTAISTDTLTITRAQESTTARSVVVGDRIAATITAKTLTDIEEMGGGGGGGNLVFLDEIIVGAGGSASIDFTGISQDYEDLQVELLIRGEAAALNVVPRMQFNGDTGSNYGYASRYSFAGGNGDLSADSVAFMRLGVSPASTSEAGSFATTSIKVPFYTGTQHKTMMFLNQSGRADSAPDPYWSSGGGVWYDTDPVTQITITADSGDIGEGSAARLYGVAKEPPSGTAAASDPVFDLFGDPDDGFEFDTSSLAGLTALSNTPDVVDADTTVPGHLFLRDDASGNIATGRYIASPATPFTAITYVKTPIRQSDSAAGIFYGEATPGALNFYGPHVSSGVRTIAHLGYTNPSTVGGGTVSVNYPTVPCWVAVIAHSNSSVDYLYSYDGLVWNKSFNGNPGITIGSVGLMINSGSVLTTGAFDYLRVWNSALTFPGVP